MRWPIPHNGQVRIKRKFAWLPVQVQNEKVWLEFYYYKQVYDGGKWRKSGYTNGASRFLTLRGAG